MAVFLLGRIGLAAIPAAYEAYGIDLFTSNP